MTATSLGAAQTPVISMRGIVKHFPGVLANDRIDLDVMPGQIHTLLGENGAGKSTLMNILSGRYIADEGEIFINGKQVDFRSPHDAIQYGIGAVYQHFMLVDTFTVAENIILGRSASQFKLNLNEVEKKVNTLANQYRLKVDPKAYTWQLSVGEQQRVELLIMLYYGAEILILDEPTAVLTPQEVRELFDTLIRMKAEGKTIIFISHKLEEVMEISDMITVLRGGKKIGEIPKTETTSRDLACMMVGREVLIRVKKKPVEMGPAVLEIKNVSADNDRGLPALRGVSLDIRAGEVLGVAGVAGNGQVELAEVITGLRKSTGGQILLNGKDITNRSPKHVIDEKVGHIPEDRMGMGLVANVSVGQNLILKDYKSPELSSGPFLLTKGIEKFANRLIERFDIATPSVQTQIRTLSGGNQQKVLLAREINLEPNLMVAVHPTRGLDIGATISVRDLLLAQREKGTALLLISEDLDEVLQMSDRIAVIYEGEIQGIVSADDVDIAQIGMMMAGVGHKKQISTQENDAQ